MKAMKVIRIGDICFDPLRLVLWDKSVSKDKLYSVLAKIPISSDLEKAKQLLFSHDWQDVKINPYQITRVGICVAKNCNLRCRYCSECSCEGNGSEIPNDDILAFVADLMTKKVANQMMTGDVSPLKVIFTGGGEPTYEFSKFCELVLNIKELAQKNSILLDLDITTNGAYTIERIEFICQHFQSIMISYDGLPSIQDYNRPSPYFENTSKVVEKTIKYVITKGVPLILRTTINRMDINRMKEMADYIFSNFGTSFIWSIFPVTPKGRAAKNIQSLDNSPDFYNEFMSLLDYAKEKYGNVKISSPLFFSHKNDFYCGSLGFLTRVAWLRASGEIVTCLEMDKDQTVIGKIANNEIIYNEKCKDPLVKITQQKFIECADCIAFPFCRGGCPADHRANKNNGEEGISWDCRQTISYWTSLILKLKKEKSYLGWHINEITLEDNGHSGIYYMEEDK